MKIALTIFPVFSDKSLPLGLACINTVLKKSNINTFVFDFDLELCIANRDLYYRIHEYAVHSGDSDNNKRINYFGSRQDLFLGTLFENEFWLPEIRKQHPLFYYDFLKIDDFIQKSIATILKYDADQIWFSCYVSNLWISMLAAKKIKAVSGSKILFGGPALFGTDVQKFILKNNIADFIIAGEGEQTAVEFVQRYPSEINGLEGLAYLSDGKYTFQQPGLPKKMDDLMVPDFSDFPLPGKPITEYLKRKFEGLPVSFSRSCLFRCSYCTESFIWGRFRSQSVDTAIQKLKYYMREYNICAFYISDCLINFNKKWLNEFCDRILSEKLDIIFTFVFAQPRNLDYEMLQKMVRSGFTRISFGMESGSQRILDKMNKKLMVDEMQQVIVDSVKAGLSVSLSSMVNFPGENINDIILTIQFLKNIDDELLLSGIAKERLPRRSLGNRFRLEHDTEIFNDPKKYGIEIRQDMTLSRFSENKAYYIPNTWEPTLADPDEELRFYILSQFNNKTSPWRITDEQYDHLAKALQTFCKFDMLAFSLSPHIQVIPDHHRKKTYLFDHDQQYALNADQEMIINMLMKGTTIRKIIKQSTKKSAPLTEPVVTDFLLGLYVRDIARLQ